MECECQFCKNNLPFDLPDDIIDAVLSGELVIFAGSGISTETTNVFIETFYQDIASELNITKGAYPDFPQLMSQYCRQKNGRKLLLDKIKARFDYCDQFQELYRIATKFHNELSSIYQIRNIFTTNWDDYFERECNAIPIVNAQDFAFYDADGRKVFKIHGSISNYGSIVATTEDYNNCYRDLKKGLIGGFLKTVLATKVVVFIGFSFSDFDFNKIYSYLKQEMKEVLPHCYIVTLDQTFKAKFSKEKATVIITDGSYFISAIRQHLEGSNVLIPKEHLDTVYVLSYERSNIHQQSAEYFLKTKSIAGIYNLFYQDGLQHAFDYLKYHSKSGMTFSPLKISSSIATYEILKRRLLKDKNYPDYAYTEGYIAGLYSIFQGDELDDFPFFYIIGYGAVATEKEFKRLLKKQRTYHKTADKIGKKIFGSILAEKAEIIPHHSPFLS